MFSRSARTLSPLVRSWSLRTTRSVTHWLKPANQTCVNTAVTWTRPCRAPERPSSRTCCCVWRRPCTEVRLLMWCGGTRVLPHTVLVSTCLRPLSRRSNRERRVSGRDAGLQADADGRLLPQSWDRAALQRGDWYALLRPAPQGSNPALPHEGVPGQGHLRRPLPESCEFRNALWCTRSLVGLSI